MFENYDIRIYIAYFVCTLLCASLLYMLKIMCEDQGFLISRWNGKIFVPLMKVKAKEEADKVLELVGSKYQKNFVYKVEAIYGLNTARVSVRVRVFGLWCSVADTLRDLPNVKRYSPVRVSNKLLRYLKEATQT